AEVVGVCDADDQHLVARRREADQRVLRRAAEARSDQGAIRREQGEVGDQRRARQARGERLDGDLLPGQRLEGKVIYVTIEADLAEEVDGKGNALGDRVVRLDLVAVAAARAEALDGRRDGGVGNSRKGADAFVLGGSSAARAALLERL